MAARRASPVRLDSLTAAVLLLVVALGGGALAGSVPVVEPVPVAAAPADLPGQVRAALEDLDGRAAAVNRAYEPFRRRAPADPAAWNGVDDLLRAVDAMATSATTLRLRVDALRGTDGFRPEVRPTELRRRLAAVDSLVTVARSLAGYDWRPTLPDDPAEARLRVRAVAREAKLAGDRTAAAAGDLAYAVGVTEGINIRALNLSLVGVVVVFTVLSLIAGVVASVRRLDDGWQVQERERAAQAIHREPTLDTTTVVLIAAACATLITGRHRIRRIRRLLSPAAKRTPWSAQGRLILQGSHAVSRKHN
jgi:Na+-transporting methylmalonyl-CoA/oxaloacetate decarboxylase gamma subunit